MVQAGATQYMVVAMAAPEACAACTLLQQCAPPGGPSALCLGGFSPGQFSCFMSAFSVQIHPRILLLQRQRTDHRAWNRADAHWGASWRVAHSRKSCRSFGVEVTPYGGWSVRRRVQWCAVRASAEENKGDDGQESNVPTASSSGDGSDGDESRSGKPESTEGTPGASSSGRPAPGSPPSSWWRKPRWTWTWSWKGNVQAHEVGALLLQLGAVFLLMRMLRPPYSAQSQASQSGESMGAVTYVNVAFSEFLSKVRHNEVDVVEVDGVHLTFSLKPQAPAAVEAAKEMFKATAINEAEDAERRLMAQGDLVSFAQLARSNPVSKRILYTTTRPCDVSTPYEKMLENGVEFSAPDKRSIRLINTFSVGCSSFACQGNYRQPIRPDKP